LTQTKVKILIQNGIDGQQTEAHFSINIIPRKEGDGLNLSWTPKKISEEEISDVVLKISDSMNKKEEPVLKKEVSSEEVTEGPPKENYMIKQLRRIP